MNGSLPSRTTGLTFRSLDHGLRLIDTATSEMLPSAEEVQLELDRERAERLKLVAERDHEQERLEAEERAQAAEGEIRRLRKEMERRG